jgi:hypothetical protein
MANQTKCIIDNWSLQHAGTLLNETEDYFILSDEKYVNVLGGLSNFINCILLYDNSSYPANGYESSWAKFSSFEKIATQYITPADTSILNLDWDSSISFADSGLKNYLLTSNYFKSDLFIAPDRTEKMFLQESLQLDDNFIKTLKKIDNLINEQKSDLWYVDAKISMQDNFILPSLTQYVFSESMNLDDLVTVIKQLKRENKVEKIRAEINEISSDPKRALKFQKDVENLVKSSFGLKQPSNSSWSIRLPIFFLSVAKNINLNFFNRNTPVLFLKNIANCRTESHGLSKHVERLFKRKIISS